MKQMTWAKIVADSLAHLTLSPIYYVTALLWLMILPAPLAIVATYIFADIFDTIYTYREQKQ